MYGNPIHWTYEFIVSSDLVTNVSRYLAEQWQFLLKLFESFNLKYVGTSIIAVSTAGFTATIGWGGGGVMVTSYDGRLSPEKSAV